MSNQLDCSSSYNVPRAAAQVFHKGILENPLIASHLPREAEACSQSISFTGSSFPSIPIPWRFAESISALKALEGTFINILLGRKYGVSPQEITINTDHAQLFIMSTMLYRVDPAGEDISANSIQDPNGLMKLYKYFPNWDIHRLQATFHRQFATNIYRTKDGRFFHLHGSMNPNPTLDSVGLPYEREAATQEEGWAPFMEKISQLTAEEMQHRVTDVHRQAGTICWSIEEYRASAHGRANAHVGLYEIHHRPISASQTAGWWRKSPQTSAQRPLAGLKVVELGRAVAAPTIARGLAELGASVMRITAPHLADLSSVHPDLNWGKWNACLDLRRPTDCEKLRGLILDADVVIQGYRPGVLEKYGFGHEGVLEMCKDRDFGIIYVRENSYGWNGPWAERSGWQQISDACCGVSMEFGRAMGNDEPVTPVFPNSDYCTGEIGTIATIDAILRRAEEGGSYVVDIALNYYSRWLTDSCGTYSNDVWEKLWVANGKQVFRHYHAMPVTVPAYLKMLQENSADKLFRPEFFEDRHCAPIDRTMRIVAPVLRFPAGIVRPGYHVGARTNGVDKPRWPEDLTIEIVD